MDTYEINELIEKLIANQNKDGSFGYERKNIRASYFVIAMALYWKENQQYLKYIAEAVSYLVEENNNSIESYIAIKLVLQYGIYREIGVTERVITMERDDREGSLIYLFNILLKSTEEFSLILFNEGFNRKELIKYLLNKI